MEFKTCAKCKEEKPHTSFYQNRCKKDGLQGYCKNCNYRSKKITSEIQNGVTRRCCKG